MELLTSSKLPVTHGFATRLGGVSREPYASLNVGQAVGDDPKAVRENLRRLAVQAGVEPGCLVTISQVHGHAVLEALESADRSSVAPPMGQADAVWTQKSDHAVAVKTADCVPLLMVDPVAHRVAAVHAGWRGVIGEIVVRAIDRLEGRGAKRDELRVALGPAIQACCFEVDGELPAKFSAAFGDGVIRPQPGKSRVHLDLSWAVARSLERAGVPSSHVDVLPHCTRCDQRFFSHRRDQGLTGRQLSLIQCVRGTAM